MNTEKLMQVMAEKGISIRDMCSILGISRKAFWQKRKGKTEFKQSEIAKIIDLLGSKNGTAIFFPNKVS